MPEGLPPRRANRRRRLLERSAHSVEDGFDHAERQREGDENIREYDRARGEHDLNTLRCEQATESSVWSPKQQQRKAGNCCWNCRRKRDGDDERVAPPEVVTRQHVRGEQAEDDVEHCRPKARGHREFEREDGFGRHQRRPELVESGSCTKDEDRSERKKHQRHHHEHKHEDAQRSGDVEPAHMSHCWNYRAHYFFCTWSLKIFSITSGYALSQPPKYSIVNGSSMCPKSLFAWLNVSFVVE